MRGMLIATAVVLAGCSSPIAEPEEDGRVLGVIESHGDEARIEIPERVGAGEDFTVTVETFGGGCVGQGDTESSVDGLTAAIRPYDYDRTGLIPDGAVCTSELRIYHHEATIRFTERGVAWVRVYGRHLPGAEVVTVTRRVLVD